MPKQIFDQKRPRSTMAQRLDEAFAGCDEWTVIAARRRRSTLDFTPTATRATRIFDGAELLQAEEPRAV
ncbi:MAG TPA: hypothetical protein VFS54_10060 [Solirubrobacterales bacterium]|nr:hypothetical protein [Solirubrobacterales bacterium]